jgi:hypothetical protein
VFFVEKIEHFSGGKDKNMKKELALCALYTIFFHVLLAAGDGTDTSSIDTAFLTINSEPTIKVFALHFRYNYPVEIEIGHSEYEIPFKNISELQIYKEMGTLKARVKDIHGNNIEGNLRFGWLLEGTTKEDGFEGKFEVYPESVDKIKVVRVDKTSSQIFGGNQYGLETKTGNYKDYLIINTNIINQIFNEISYNFYLQITLFSLTLIAIIETLIRFKRRKETANSPKLPRH